MNNSNKPHQFSCKQCGIKVIDKEDWDKLEPEQRKNFNLQHDWNLNGMKINHECLIKCKNNDVGGDCGKMWKLTEDNCPLIMFKHLALFENSSCVDCRLKHMEKQIEEWKKENKVPNKETKEWYEELKRIAGKNNDSNKPTERERERANHHYLLQHHLHQALPIQTKLL